MLHAIELPFMIGFLMKVMILHKVKQEMILLQISS